MNKLLALVATAAVASTLTSAALAQSREGDRPTVNQIVAYDQARIARLKADLRLKQDQESAWNKLESTMLDISKRRAERMLKFVEEGEKRSAEPTQAERLREQADRLTEHAEDLRKLADAFDGLQKFDDGQRRRTSEFVQQFASRQGEFTPERRRR
jgi:ribosomal protein S15P/S13E